MWQHIGAHTHVTLFLMPILQALVQGAQARGGIGGVGGAFHQGKPGPWMLAMGWATTFFSLELGVGGPGPEKAARLGWLLHDLSFCQCVSLAGFWAEGNL